ncbi:MAG: glutathione S-transferase [Proteobacteria bacterium]|nr:glutathione S-transferase [Pseudomonadota bacterium]
MITVWGEGRGIRVVWLLEEMGLPYRLRDVNLLEDISKDTEFLAINPCGFIPALQDGDMVMVESIAIMEYLLGRYGRQSKSALAPAPDAPNFGLYQQFLHLGEAGLAGMLYFHVITKNIAPEAERNNWTARESVEIFRNRLQLVSRQLALAPYMAGEYFTAADISVTYALTFAQAAGGLTLGKDERNYWERMTARDGYKRALSSCHATRNWLAKALS